jgi:hypothetical protein
MRDVDAAGDPGLALIGDVPENPVERADSPRPADHAQVKPDRQHLGRVHAFPVQPVEGLDDIFRKIRCTAESLRVKKLHVVGIESIGQHEVAVATDLDEIRQIVVIGVAVVEKAAFFDQQPPGAIRSRRSSVLADRPNAGCLPDRRDGQCDTLALRRLVERVMAFPAPAMRRDLVPAPHRVRG